VAIRVKVPKEIKDYREKILFFGMSLRQLLFFVLTLAIAIGGSFYCVKILGMKIDTAGNIIIPLLVPIVAFGWVRKNGMSLEKYLKVVFKHQLKVGKRIYQTREKVPMSGFNKKENQKKLGETTR
jgi:hypothetical protein